MIKEDAHVYFYLFLRKKAIHIRFNFVKDGNQTIEFVFLRKNIYPKEDFISFNSIFIKGVFQILKQNNVSVAAQSKI